MHNKAECFKIKKIKRKNIRQFEQRYSVEPKGFEMNQSKGTFLKNQIFFPKFVGAAWPQTAIP